MSTLDGRFELGEPLAPGPHAPRRAVDRQTGEACVVRELTLGRISDWKQLELFERETQALRQLDHDGIPRFVASTRSEEDDEPRYYLVQSYVEGTPLSERIGRLTPDEIVEVLTGLLEILAYLQSFSPPVLHRDITPDKILIRPDGTVALVDFGAVQVELHGTTGGSTMVGTSGYMAPEQLMGRAVPGSEIFAVGATFVHTLVGVSPGELATRRMKLQWRDRARSNPDRLLDVIDRMIEPDPNERFENAREVLRALGGGALSVSRPGAMIRATRPAGTDIDLRRSGRRLQIKVVGRAKVPWTYLIAAFVLGAAFAFTGFFVFGGNVPYTVLAGLLGGAIFGIPMLVSWIANRRTDGRLILDVDRGFRVRAPEYNAPMIAGPFRDIVGPDRGHGAQRGMLLLATEDEMLPFATACTQEEQDWLIDEIADFIREHRR